MILLASIVEGAVAAVNDLATERLAHRTRVGIMAIGRHSLRPVTNDSSGLLEKAPGRLHVSLLA
jgi:hypothetical protein